MLRSAMPGGMRGVMQRCAPSKPALWAQYLPIRIYRPVTQRTFTHSSTIARKAPTPFTFSSHPRPSPPTILQRLRSSVRPFHRSRARPSGNTATPNPAEAQSLGARMRRLSREYGWSAVGVYFALSALDFPFCYLLVIYLGTERIGEWERIVVSNVEKLIPEGVKNGWHEWRASMKKAEREATGSEEISDHVDMAGWGVEEAEHRNKVEASLATQLALAYAIHKSFIFVRVPLTAAVTPKVVKILRGWGWDIGKRTTKEAKALKRAGNLPKP